MRVQIWPAKKKVLTPLYYGIVTAYLCPINKYTAFLFEDVRHLCTAMLKARCRRLVKIINKNVMVSVCKYQDGRRRRCILYSGYFLQIGDMVHTVQTSTRLLRLRLITLKNDYY